MFIVNVEATGLSTIETPMLLGKNPIGAAKTMQFWQIHVSNLHTVTSFLRYRLYINPIITNVGLSVPVISSAGGLSTIPNMLVSSQPLISSFGNRAETWIVGSGLNSTTLIIPCEFHFTIKSGTNFLITAQADGTLRVGAINLWWREVPE